MDDVTLVLLILMTSAAELALFTKLFWGLRKQFVLILAPLVISLSLFLFIQQVSLLTIIIFVASAGRVINYFKIAADRLHPDYLRHSVYRSTVVLFLVQLGSGLLMIMFPDISKNSTAQLLITSVIQLTAAVIIFVSLVRTIARTKYHQSNVHYSDNELPTVTVAIPARNENQDLEECIASILANDYQKLEVIVLDDDSTKPLRDTVKDFAHDGVRFIRSTNLKPSWLAKNQAYEQLAKAASGSVILFCSVDVRLEPTAIRAVVSFMKTRNKDMVSIMPFRKTGSFFDSILQPISLWWELGLPRKAFNRPAVFNAAWAIKRDRLFGLGGFAGVKRSVLPEIHFAREIVKGNGYSILRAGSIIGVLSTKTMAEQRITTLRIRYPQFKQRLETLLLVSTLELIIIFGPFAITIYAVLANEAMLSLLAISATILLILTHATVLFISNPRAALFAALLLPISAVADIYSNLESMFRYEFSSVEWKGRKLDEPVMHVIPRLPQI